MTQYSQHIQDTEFFDAVMKDVFGPREGGAIFLVDAKDARKGVGKTSAAVGLAALFSKYFGWEVDVDDLVLSGDEYLDRLRDHPATEQPSCVVWDEAVGAGSGDSRRSMAEQNRVLSQAWQLLRTKRILSFVTLPDMFDLDSRLCKLADYRIFCLREPIGYFKAYEIGTPFRGSDIITRGLGKSEGAQRISFPDLPSAGHPLYNQLAAKKDKLIDDGNSFDADDVLRADPVEEEEDQGYSPEEVVDEIESRGSLDAYLKEAPGGLYINRDLLKHDYELTNSDSKTVKALLERRFDLDVM